LRDDREGRRVHRRGLPGRGITAVGEDDAEDQRPEEKD
jgi:hypothetical protein